MHDQNRETASIGRNRWAIAEGYIPRDSHGPAPAMTSHEAACILNASHRDAHIEITIFFVDREPAGPFRLKVPARRTRHIRFNDLNEPETIPARHALFEHHRVRRADRSATYAARFSPIAKCAA